MQEKKTKNEKKKNDNDKVRREDQAEGEKREVGSVELDAEPLFKGQEQFTTCEPKREQQLANSPFFRERSGWMLTGGLAGNQELHQRSVKP